MATVGPAMKLIDRQCNGMVTDLGSSFPPDFRHHVVLRAEADHHPEALPRRKHGSVRRVFHETSPAREEVAKRHRVGIPRDLAELEDPGHVQDW
eukprot:CAMPEP_0179004364 /NCGR_PEP_ID=MMETSP0795-20121207/13257_1 /TAXON_ID=88552 /ORGANISM="Amoebophrya sp., Strain Ameob2" /LENGTH=93 /DNA_ID=CAMNT_0020698605 /DNA_START=510 /DNA_END=787 /DNA_ORIENTATION=+